MHILQFTFTEYDNFILLYPIAKGEKDNFKAKLPVNSVPSQLKSNFLAGFESVVLLNSFLRRHNSSQVSRFWKTVRQY